MRNFLSIEQLSVKEIQTIIQTAINEKYALKMGRPQYSEALYGKILAMIFQKPSTRTRISFDVGMRQLGGSTIILNTNDIHLGTSETISDTAKVLSRMVNAIMLRCYKEEDLLELAQNASIPVVNALTNESHPCQILAAAMTFMEHGKDLNKSKLTWLGDFNNVTNSYIELAEKLGFEFIISTPEITRKQQNKLEKAQSINSKIIYEKDPQIAVSGADVIITDTWISMGDSAKNIEKYIPYQVNTKITPFAKKDFIFSHCLPAHRGEEVTNEIIDGKHSIVFDEAENRLHVQKAILLYMFGII
jgi:ornithine carbamoyltransferase